MDISALYSINSSFFFFFFFLQGQWFSCTSMDSDSISRGTVTELTHQAECQSFPLLPGSWMEWLELSVKIRFLSLLQRPSRKTPQSPSAKTLQSSSCSLYLTQIFPYSSSQFPFLPRLEIEKGNKLSDVGVRKHLFNNPGDTLWETKNIDLDLFHIVGRSGLWKTVKNPEVELCRKPTSN